MFCIVYSVEDTKLSSKIRQMDSLCLASYMYTRTSVSKSKVTYLFLLVEKTLSSSDKPVLSGSLQTEQLETMTVPQAPRVN